MTSWLVARGEMTEDSIMNTEMAVGSPTMERTAPRFHIPPRRLSAVEVPAIVEDVDRAVQALGRQPTLTHILDSDKYSIPIYLNPESPFCKPLMSHNARTHNVLLKVTVPRRTGRKRKKGSDGPWEGDIEIRDKSDMEPEDTLCSRSRMDDPRTLRRKLQDNVDKYGVEAVGLIKHTHRFRGLADFIWDMGQSDFTGRYLNQVLPGDVDLMKGFKFNEGIDKAPSVDIIPPPLFTQMNLPFNWNYTQNPYVRTTEEGQTYNATAVKQIGYFIAAEDPTPTGPQIPPDMHDPRMVKIIADLEEAFAYRPIWTRRSLMNHLSGKLRSWNELKKYLSYTAYQFKGGPWRDTVVPYGVDPRIGPKYREYQTLMFKLPKPKVDGESWHTLRRTQEAQGPPESHIFDGRTYHTDGKVWQLCDITDPLIRELLDNAAVRPTRDATSGWYHGGLWAKIKAIMKTKLVAVQFNRRLTREDFRPVLEIGDQTPVRTGNSTVGLPLPNLRLTDEEWRVLRGREPTKKNKHRGYVARIRDHGKKNVEEANAEGDVPNDVNNVLQAVHEENEDAGDGGGEYGSPSDEGSADEEIYPDMPTYGGEGSFYDQESEQAYDRIGSMDVSDQDR